MRTHWAADKNLSKLEHVLQQLLILWYGRVVLPLVTMRDAVLSHLKKSINS